MLSLTRIGIPCSGPANSPDAAKLATGEFAGCSETCVELIGACRRRGIDRDHGVERWPLLIVSGDALEIGVDEAARSQTSLRDRVAGTVDRRLFDWKVHLRIRLC